MAFLEESVRLKHVFKLLICPERIIIWTCAKLKPVTGWLFGIRHTKARLLSNKFKEKYDIQS